jgi:hypothetical protein
MLIHPGVGIVRIEFYVNHSLHRSLTLKSYSIY